MEQAEPTSWEDKLDWLTDAWPLLAIFVVIFGGVNRWTIGIATVLMACRFACRLIGAVIDDRRNAA